MFHVSTNARKIDKHTQLVAAELRAEAARRQFTQERLSELSGIPRSTVGKILAGNRAIDIREMAALANAMGIRPSSILERVESQMDRPKPPMPRAVTSLPERRRADLSNLRGAASRRVKEMYPETPDEGL